MMRKLSNVLFIPLVLSTVGFTALFLSTIRTLSLPRVFKLSWGYHGSQNIVFLKIHKTGSSTFANILQRFGLQRSLNFALPNKCRGEIRYNYFGPLGGTLKASEIKPSKPGSKEYNILYNHVVFNKEAFDEIFSRTGATYVTMLREPIAQFKSALLFFQHKTIYEAATRNFSSYLSDPRKYEPEYPFLSFTNNRQALDLGLSSDSVRNETQIRQYIDVLEQAFDLVMLTEYFDESLIMLKRKMNWAFKDIIYIRKNKAYRAFDFRISTSDAYSLNDWLFADVMIYSHFYERFMANLRSDSTVTEEVASFKGVLGNVQNFCSGNTSSSRLYIQGSRWNSPFYVTSLDCVYMMMGELDFLSKLSHGH